jgi:glutathione S-transferase
MITLYGFAISNYYNKVKWALLEKNIPFQEQVVAPSQEESVLQRSPLGKIPFIQTPDGYLSESQAILEYLEDAFPEHPLYAQSAYQRAKQREYIQHLELNVELIARRIYGEALFGRSASQECKDEVLEKLQSNLHGLQRLLKFAPYALGEEFGIADIVTWPHLQLISAATQKLYGDDLPAKYLPQLAEYNALIESRPHAQKVASDRAEALAAFFANR